MGMDSLPGRVHKAVQLPRSCLAGQWRASVLGGDTRFRDQALALPVSLPASVKHPACLKSCRNEGRKINDISAGVGQGLHGVNDLVTQAVVGQAGLLTAAPAVTCSDPLRRRVECARWYHWCSTIRVRSEPHGRVAPPACRSRTVVGELASHGSARRASAAAGCSRRPAPARLRLSVVCGQAHISRGKPWPSKALPWRRTPAFHQHRIKKFHGAHPAQAGVAGSHWRCPWPILEEGAPRSSWRTPSGGWRQGEPCAWPPTSAASAAQRERNGTKSVTARGALAAAWTR